MTGTPALAGLRFTGTWRHYQRLALDALERDRAAGRRRTHIVAPPGSGKTLVGVEAVRMLGAPAVVLVPNTAVQAQWIRAARLFGGADGVIGTTPGHPVTVLTYQALCRLDDPDAALADIAAARWTAERAASTGQAPEEVDAEAAGWQGEAARRRTAEVRRITAGLKREIARAEHGHLHLAGLLHPGARERLDALVASGVGTVVLDECHHLASMWGYVVRVMVEELGDVHVIGLTATPPGELTGEEEDLYAGLLGDVDFTVPTPAVVREGHLAPYQELAWLTRPLDSEAAWLAAHDQRFRELVTALHADPDGPLSFPAWVVGRARHRTDGATDARVSWAGFARERPRLARACARFLASAGLAPPEGMPTGEGYREEPNLEDWLTLLEDYAQRRLRPDGSDDAARRLEAVAAALRDLGFTLTRTGLRRGTSDVDRLLTTSAAKSVALTEVVGLEHARRGDALRALVLCDAEVASAAADPELRDVLRPEAGTAVEAVRALADDARTAHLRPLLVSGRGLRCAPADGDALLAAVRAHAPGHDGWATEPDDDGLVRLTARGGWEPRVWVAAATAAFTEGGTRCLVGTRALLGEGWDAPCVNTLVDLTATTTRVSVNQMRGRSLRLDPADPAKLASNWDVVCIAPDLARGDADYDRFVRRHRHLYAPTDDGVIEAGPTHVHPALGPFAPPAAQDFAAMNRDMARRAHDHDRARALWAIGSPYRGEDHRTLVVRTRRAGARETPVGAGPPAFPTSPAPTVIGAAGGVVAAGLATLAAGPVGLVALAAVPVAVAAGLVRMSRLRRELHEVLPLEAAALAVRDAYAALGELSPEAAASLAIEPRTSGYLRVWLRDATAAESAAFTASLGELVDPPAAAARYLVSRMVPGRTGVGSALARTVWRGLPYPVRWTAVPSDLARRKERAEAFRAAWTRWLGPGELVFAQHEGAAAAQADAAAHGSDHEASVRDVWV